MSASEQSVDRRWNGALTAILFLATFSSSSSSSSSISAFVDPVGRTCQRLVSRSRPWEFGPRRGAPQSGTSLGATSSKDLKLRRRRRGSTATDPEAEAEVSSESKDEFQDDDHDHDHETFVSLAENSGLVRLQRAAARALETHAGGESASTENSTSAVLPPPAWATTPAGWGGSGTALDEGDMDGGLVDEPPAGSLRRLNRNIDRRLRALEDKRRMMGGGGGADFDAAGWPGAASPLSRRASFEDFDGGGESGLGGVVRGRTPVSAVVPPVRDSMSSLLLYNHVKGDWTKHASASTFNVAVVLGKRLVRDQITVEYASRIRTLARLFKEEPLFRPSLVCFCGGVGPGNHVSDADAGYIFFRHMCEAQGIDLEGVSVFIDSDPASGHEGIALQHVTNEVRKKYLREWLKRSPAEEAVDGDGGADTSFGGMFAGAGDGTGTGRRRKKVAVHFSLVSTEYHLCNLNDVHHRSPRQSLLKSIEELREAGSSDTPVPGPYGRMMDNDSSVSVEWDDEGNTYIRDDRRWDDDDIYVDDEYRDFERPYRRSFPAKSGKGRGGSKPSSAPRIQGVVETSWSFQYATYPFLYAKDEAVVFLGKCFLLGEELTPLLANMKGVVDQKEFFQRDNYLMLASIRRSLVSHVERLHSKRTALKTALKEYSSGRKDVAAVLEGALLSLGRCVDVVRPAGLLVSSVSKTEWTRALGQLRHSMEEIRGSCDPDRPLRPTEWGKLVDDEAATLDIGAPTDSAVSKARVPIQSVVAAAAAAAAVAAATNNPDEGSGHVESADTDGENERRKGNDGALSMFVDE